MARNVLYFAENAISPVQGRGIVAYAALKGLPPENLLGIYLYRSITPAAEYADRMHPLPNILRSEEQTRQNLLPPSPVSRFGDAPPWLERARALVGPLVDLLGGYDQHVEQLARRNDFRPEVVFAAPLSLRMLMLAVTAARRYRIPLVMLNMDDWMAEESARFGRMHGLWEEAVRRGMAAARPHVAYAYSNSAKLAGILTERYGIPHDTINNASHDLFEPGRSWTPPPARSRTVITFAGAMNWTLQGQTLVRVSEAVAELRRDHDVELRIFAPWEFAPLANLIAVPDAVTYGGFRSAPELAQAYLDSDFLILTTTFRDDKIPLFRHSLATKLSDYLCAGRPVLSVGHPDWAVHEYVDQNQCGFSGRLSERTDIKKQILRAIHTPMHERARIGQANRRLWEQAHDVRIMGAKVRSILGLREDDAVAAGRTPPLAAARV